MPRHQVRAEAIIDALAGVAFSVIADERDGLPRILPRPPFGSLEVERGEIGEGTRIKYRMRKLGRTQTFHAAITEPDPGRVLVETIAETGAETTFTVDTVGGGARVAITTAFETRGGLPGRMERLFLTRLLQPVYVREIERPDAVASKWANGKG